jgi:hypothetical protein
LAALAYQPSGLLAAGFAAGRPDERALQKGLYASIRLPSNSPALVFWVRTYGILPGDEQTIRLIAPDEIVIAESSRVSPKPLAEGYSYAGAQRQGGAFKPGTYRGEYTLTRSTDTGEQVVVRASRNIELQ